MIACDETNTVNQQIPPCLERIYDRVRRNLIAVENYRARFWHLQNKAAFGKQRTFARSHECTCSVWNPVAEAYDQWIGSSRVSSRIAHCIQVPDSLSLRKIRENLRLSQRHLL